MWQIHFETGPDPMLAWLVYLVLAFLVLVIVVGALAGSKVFSNRAPSALRDDDEERGPAQGTAGRP